MHPFKMYALMGSDVSIYKGNCNYNQFIGHFHHPKKFPLASWQDIPQPQVLFGHYIRLLSIVCAYTLGLAFFAQHDGFMCTSHSSAVCSFHCWVVFRCTDRHPILFTHPPRERHLGSILSGLL